MSAELDALRPLLNAPSKKGWAAICALFDAWPPGPGRAAAHAEAEAALDAWPGGRESLLVGWPMPLRRAPKPWKRLLLKGEAAAGWPLVRFLQCHDDKLCREAGVRGFSRMNKAQRIEALLRRWDEEPTCP